MLFVIKTRKRSHAYGDHVGRHCGRVMCVTITTSRKPRTITRGITVIQRGISGALADHDKAGREGSTCHFVSVLKAAIELRKPVSSSEAKFSLPPKD